MSSNLGLKYSSLAVKLIMMTGYDITSKIIKVVAWKCNPDKYLILWNWS